MFGWWGIRSMYVEYLPPVSSRLYAAIIRFIIIHPLQFHPQQRKVLSVHPLHECSGARQGIRTPDCPSDMGGCLNADTDIAQ